VQVQEPGVGPVHKHEVPIVVVVGANAHPVGSLRLVNAGYWGGEHHLLYWDLFFYYFLNYFFLLYFHLDYPGNFYLFHDLLLDDPRFRLLDGLPGSTASDNQQD
jgi:hypothetical protein